MVTRGHDVTIMTNYPKWALRRLVQECRLETNAVHGMTMRAALAGRFLPYIEPAIHESFGSWAARTVAKRPYDLVHVWSGVAQEILDSSTANLRTLMRGSSHIVEQSRLLQAEEDRTGVAQDKPSRWMIDRELREYERADKIIVLSRFAANSFRQHGIREPQLKLIPLGC